MADDEEEPTTPVTGEGTTTAASAPDDAEAEAQAAAASANPSAQQHTDDAKTVTQAAATDANLSAVPTTAASTQQHTVAQAANTGANTPPPQPATTTGPTTPASADDIVTSVQNQLNRLYLDASVNGQTIDNDAIESLKEKLQNSKIDNFEERFRDMIISAKAHAWRVAPPPPSGYNPASQQGSPSVSTTVAQVRFGVAPPPPPGYSHNPPPGPGAQQQAQQQGYPHNPAQQQTPQQASPSGQPAAGAQQTPHVYPAQPNVAHTLNDDVLNALDAFNNSGHYQFPPNFLDQLINHPVSKALTVQDIPDPSDSTKTLKQFSSNGTNIANQEKTPGGVKFNIQKACTIVMPHKNGIGFDIMKFDDSGNLIHHLCQGSPSQSNVDQSWLQSKKTTQQPIITPTAPPVAPPPQPLGPTPPPAPVPPPQSVGPASTATQHPAQVAQQQPARPATQPAPVPPPQSVGPAAATQHPAPVAQQQHAGPASTATQHPGPVAPPQSSQPGGHPATGAHAGLPPAGAPQHPATPTTPGAPNLLTALNAATQQSMPNAQAFTPPQTPRTSRVTPNPDQGRG